MKRFQLSAVLLTAVMLAGAGIPAQAAEETFHRTRLGEYKLVTEPDSETEPKTLRYASTKREYNIYSVYGDGSSGFKIEFNLTKDEVTKKTDAIIADIKNALPQDFVFEKHSAYGIDYNDSEFRISHLNYREAAALYDTISKQYPLKAFHYYPDCGSFNYSGISLFISAEDAVRVNEYLKANAPDWYYDSEAHRMGSNQPYSAYDLCRMIYKVSEEFGFEVGGMTTCLATFGADGFDTDFVKLDAQYKEISEAQTQAAYDKYIKDAALEKRETVRLTVKIPNETVQQMRDDLGIPAAYCRTDYLTPTETHRTESYIAEALKLSGNYQLLEARNAYTVSTGKATDADTQYFAVMCRTEPNTGDASNAYPKDTDAAQIIAYLTESNPYNIEYLVSEAYYTGGKNPLILQKGDLDGDGTVSAEDAQLALNLYTEIVAERALADANQLAAADINQDGELSADDVQYILMFYTRSTLARKETSWEQILADSSSN
ncbi:MAG: dockerin type I repeat-containing protein [Oscillospiraceae bacterium]|nr:dockerin type I repeat-containing protein [Oscillospiraceae bacterium]